VQVTDCPLVTVPAEAWEVVEMADWFFERSILPAAGGVLDQARVFMAACRMLRPEVEKWKAKLKIG
jgi:hypothetical protein